MPEHTFATFLQRAVRQSGKSLDQIVQALKRKGCKLNKSTLSRWQNGRSNPIWKNLDALQHLPHILRTSTADHATYHHLLSQIIGGYQTPYSQSPIPRRVRFFGGELPLA